MMKGSSCRSLEVFDFKEDDELPELVSGRFLGKFKHTCVEDQDILKYKFLECVASGTNVQAEELCNVTCLDVDALDDDHDFINANSHSVIRKSNKGDTGFAAVHQSRSVIHGENFYLETDNQKAGSSFCELKTREMSPKILLCDNDEADCDHQQSPSSNGSGDGNSDASPSVNESSSPSTFVSHLEEKRVSLDSSPMNYCMESWDMDDANEASVSPDFLVYRGTYSTDALVTFSSQCIEVKDSLTCRNKGILCCRWEIDDIIDVECHWCGSAELAMVKLHMISRYTAAADKVHSASGIEELNFTVVDPNWPEKQEKIISLNVKYRAAWNVVFDTDMGMDKVALLGENNFSSKRYFPVICEPFKDVVYPKEDSDPVSISKRDFDLLRPETFINDTIIDFYIKFLKNKLQPEERSRFHFFNSFFFRKLVDLEKDQSSTSRGRAAFLRVRKWTRKVNLFEKDYIFVPINFNLHWSLIVICHPGEVATFKDVDVENERKVPCILHMDSIKGFHTGLKNHVQSYLLEEWRERHDEVSEEISSKFLNMRFVPLELPQQENSFDCGLFLLHYAELFLEEAPVHFNPFKITKFSNFLNVNWFLPAEASLKRAAIQRLIYKLLKNRSLGVSPAADGDKKTLEPMHNEENETGVELISGNTSMKASHESSFSCQASHGIEMTVTAPFSSKSSQFTENAGMVLREFFDAQAATGSLVDEKCRPLDPAASLCVKEDAETDEQFRHPTSSQTRSHPASGITLQVGCPILSSGNFEERASWLVRIPADEEVSDSSLETSSVSVSEDSAELGVLGNNLVEKTVDEGRTEQGRSRSPSTELAEASSSGLVETNAGIDSRDSDSNEGETLCESLEEESDTQTKRDIDSCDGLEPESNEQPPPVKKPRLAPFHEGEREITRSISNDLHS